MSDQVTSKGQHMELSIQDDDEPLIYASERSKKPKSYFCELISKISRRFGQLKQWPTEEGVRSSRINKDYTCPIRFKKCLVKTFCETVGYIFCNPICTGVCLFLYIRCIKPFGSKRSRFYNRSLVGSIVRCPIGLKNFIVNAMCVTIGYKFCNRIFAVVGLFLVVCCLEFGCRLLRLYKRHNEEPKERDQYDVQKPTEKYESLMVRLSDSETEVNRLETKLHETEENLDDVRRFLENERREKNISNSRLNDSESEVKRLETRLQEERYEKEDALKKVEEEKREKEKALTRLSAVAGDKLRLNNPGIADLSDENRPNKLAEKFSELYDNEWTEVFEVVEEESIEEEKIIEMLLEVLKEIYNSCLKYARDQRKNLLDAIAKPSKSNVQLEVSPEGIMSKVIDLQKQTASVAFLDVKNAILQMKTLSQFTDHKVKQKYLDRCIQLCWMMAIQDPPMMLDFGPGQEEEVDKNTFRMYTKQGDRVDFIVWPAVFLHENGPLVQKGVLQPKVLN